MDRLAIVGCGSIGSRHARNARALGVDEIVLCDSSEARRSALAAEVGAASTFASVEAALGANLSAAVVATPSSLHVEHALAFVEREIPVLVEKPLAVSSEQALRFVEAVERCRVVTMIAQSFRFHEGLREVERILREGSIGSVRLVIYDSGQYLPDWHPAEDYRKEYSARRALGGGALLTSMSHGLDTIEWLFGEIRDLSGWKTKSGELELEEGVDDVACCLVRTASGVVADVMCDFLDRRGRHRLLVVGALGSVEGDLVSHSIKLSLAGGEPTVRAYTFEPNARYVEELRHFFSLVDGNVVTHDLDAKHGAHIVDLLTDPRIVWR